MTASKKIWTDMKDKDINVFAMPAKVSDYFNFIEIDEVKCYLTCKASAALPALEATLGEGFKCSTVDKYVVVEKV